VEFGDDSEGASFGGEMRVGLRKGVCLCPNWLQKHKKCVTKTEICIKIQYLIGFVNFMLFKNKRRTVSCFSKSKQRSTSLFSNLSNLSPHGVQQLNNELLYDVQNLKQ